jgi:hypothetical protein
VITCLCSHSRDRHGRNAAGPHAGACQAGPCGCLWLRPDMRPGDGEPGGAVSLDELLEDILAGGVTCAGQLAVLAAPRKRPSGTCSGCGETRSLRGDGTVQQHRLWTSGSSDACSGSRRPPAARKAG